MEEVKRFKSKDGRIFGSKEGCEKHESIIDAISEAMKGLIPEPKDDGCRFGNSHGYIQQDMDKVKKAMIEVVRIAGIDLKESKENFLENPFPYRKSYYIGRVFDDSDSPAYRAWMRFYKMDDNCREWGQPYFALNPHKGESFEIKDGAGESEGKTGQQITGEVSH